ncbi:MAG TPA: LamG domain-containing protein [Capsulimonadaceae bacterium]|nr:LamG domain-containing protein [Capsulimonadaceae bacterium]
MDQSLLLYGPDRCDILPRRRPRRVRPLHLFLDGTGHLGFDISDPFNNNSDVLSANPVPLNTWTFVTCSLDDSTGTMAVYINGTLAGTNTTTFRPYGPLDPLANPGEGIGNVESSNYSFYFNGLIDDLKVYNTSAPAARAPS